MTTALLLAIATASIVILLLLVIKAKVHPFVALLIVSLLVAIAPIVGSARVVSATGNIVRALGFAIAVAEAELQAAINELEYLDDDEDDD